jgi:hypothetical protein
MDINAILADVEKGLGWLDSLSPEINAIGIPGVSLGLKVAEALKELLAAVEARLADQTEINAADTQPKIDALNAALDQKVAAAKAFVAAS